MAIEYTFKIHGVRVKSEGGLVDVVKEVDLTVTGADGAAKFELPMTVKLGDADPSSFAAFDSLTEAQLVGWVESQPVPEGMPSFLEGVKAHIAHVVAKEAQKLSLGEKPLPWAPAPSPEPAPNAPSAGE